MRVEHSHDSVLDMSLPSTLHATLYKLLMMIVKCPDRPHISSYRNRNQWRDNTIHTPMLKKSSSMTQQLGVAQDEDTHAGHVEGY